MANELFGIWEATSAEATRAERRPRKDEDRPVKAQAKPVPLKNVWSMLYNTGRKLETLSLKAGVIHERIGASQGWVLEDGALVPTNQWLIPSTFPKEGNATLMKMLEAIERIVEDLEMSLEAIDEKLGLSSGSEIDEPWRVTKLAEKGPLGH